jgi:hypothetical protein
MFIPQRNNPDYVGEDEWNIPPAEPPLPRH